MQREAAYSTPPLNHTQVAVWLTQQLVSFPELIGNRDVLGAALQAGAALHAPRCILAALHQSLVLLPRIVLQAIDPVVVE